MARLRRLRTQMNKYEKVNFLGLQQLTLLYNTMLHAVNIDGSRYEPCNGCRRRALPERQRGFVVPAHAPGVSSQRGCGQSRPGARKGEVHHHLENLGFVEGAAVSVVSEQAGNFIVQVKGANVALDRSVASKIIVA